MNKSSTFHVEPSKFPTFIEIALPNATFSLPKFQSSQLSLDPYFRPIPQYSKKATIVQNTKEFTLNTHKEMKFKRAKILTGKLLRQFWGVVPGAVTSPTGAFDDRNIGGERGFGNERGRVIGIRVRLLRGWVVVNDKERRRFTSASAGEAAAAGVGPLGGAERRGREGGDVVVGDDVNVDRRVVVHSGGKTETRDS